MRALGPMFALGLCAALFAAPARAESWVDALTELQVAPLQLGDARVPLEARIAQARALGRHGPKGPAIEVLKEALDAEPQPPARLREAIVLALAERDPKHVEEPLKTLLAAAKRQPAHDRPLFESRPRKTDAKRELDPQAIERALCEPEAAADALELLIAANVPRDELTDPMRHRVREALAGSTCLADEAHKPAADDPRVVRLRMKAAFILGAYWDAGAVPALRAALESPFADVREAAARALRELARADLDDDGKTRAAACAALDARARIEISPRVRHQLTCSQPVGRSRISEYKRAVDR